MNLSVNVILQLLMVIAQAINATMDLLPPRGRFYAMVALSAIQGLIAVLAHFVNPDGTPAARPWKQ